MTAASEARELYRSILESQVPRILGLQNRNPASRSWGCLDRSYWHYRTLVDFPCATYQQPVLGLALLSTSEVAANPFRGQGALLDAARGAMLFWARSQHRDGSHDEFYQNEHSFCPTAFTTFAVAAALPLVRERLPTAEVDEVMAGLRRAGAWLLRHDNPSVANQRMAAANALHGLATLTGDDAFAAGAGAKLAQVLDSQHPEGWFPEYGGADVGYSFKALDLLGHLMARTDDRRVAAALEPLLDFVAAFVHPDGTAGGFYGSRCAAHFIPYGLEVMAARGSATACSLLEVWAAGTRSGTSLTPLSVDDKYLAYFHFNSYAQALCAPEGVRPSGERVPGAVRVFRGGGLFAVRRGDIHLVGSGVRGGAFRLYHRGRLLCQDSGYFGVLADARRLSSHALDPESTWQVQAESETIRVEVQSRFCAWDDDLPMVRYGIPFRLFAKLVLGWGWMAHQFQRALKARKITAVRPGPYRLTRSLLVGPDRVRLCDEIRREGKVAMARLVSCPDATAAHSASTRYVARGDLEARWPAQDLREAVCQLNLSGRVRLERESLY